ncbi:MAG: tol-pal system protein YbgF [Polyangiales bacterium]
MGVSSSRLGPAFAVLFAGASVVPAGCAHHGASAASATTPEPTGAEARLEELVQRNAELEEEVRQLRGQLALAQAEVRDLRSGVGGPAAAPAPRETVRIGSAEGATHEEGYVEPPLDSEPAPRGSARGGGAERNAQASASGRDERPVLRLYGSPALPLDGAGYITVRERLPPGPDVRPLPPSAQPAPVVAAPTGAAAAPATLPAPTAQPTPQPPTPASAPTSAPGRSAEDDPAQQSYRAALALVTARRFAEANDALTRFLQQYPNHPYTDNALYWRGTVSYAERRYGDALRDFERVVAEFPRGNKVPDALYQIGMCHLRLGDRDTARSYFRRVQAEYPNTVAARLASREDAS